MTLSTTVSRSAYAGNGSTTAFTIPFKFLANSHISATLRSSLGAETAWILGTHYSLAGAGSDAGGTLTVITAPTNYTPQTGETLVIRRLVPETQETDYPESGAFPASAHESALDKLTMLNQQHTETEARTLKYPVTDSASISSEIPNSTARASKYLGFDAGGAPVALSAPVGTSVVSVFGATLIDDADAAAARTTLGLGTAAVKNTGASGDAVPLLNAANTFSAGQRGAIVALTSSAGSVAINLALGNVFEHDLTENTTLALPTNLVKGQWFSIAFRQHASAAKTLSYNAAYDFVGTTPALTATLSGYAVLTGLVLNATGGSEKIAAFLSNLA